MVIPLSCNAPLFQLLYDLGSLHFRKEEYTKAHAAFSRARKFLSHSPLSLQRLTSSFPTIEKGKLEGFLLACECVLRKKGVVVEGREREATLAQRVEELRIDDWEVRRGD